MTFEGIWHEIRGCYFKTSALRHHFRLLYYRNIHVFRGTLHKEYCVKVYDTVCINQGKPVFIPFFLYAVEFCSYHSIMTFLDSFRIMLVTLKVPIEEYKNTSIH